MKILESVEAYKLLAKALNQPLIVWGILTWPEEGAETGDAFAELTRAAPFLAGADPQVWADGTGVILCEDEAEQERIYQTIVGPDGPTESNPYDGPARVLAVTIGRDGEWHNENT